MMPGTADPRAAAVLRLRWLRVRRVLMLSSVVLPGLLVACCAGLLVLTVLGRGDFPLWAVFPLLGVVIPAAGFSWWLHRRGVLEPAGWLSAAFLIGGFQLLLGAIPSYGIAVNSTSGAGHAVAAGLFAVCWAIVALSCVNAGRARRALMDPLIPELGSTSFRLTLGVRFALTAHALVSARIDLGDDRVEWSARLHQGRGAGPRVDMLVYFGQLYRVSAVMLSGEPAWRPWLTLPDGTVLYAQPGPAVVLSTTTGDWMLPVHDAQLVVELVDRRKALWTQGNR